MYGSSIYIKMYYRCWSSASSGGIFLGLGTNKHPGYKM